MSRKIIPLISGEKYHIYNRGVDKRVVFQDSFDYIRFYQSLAFFNTHEPTQNYKLAKGNFATDCKKLVKIHAYALLSNHYHILVEQVVDGGISEFIKRVSVGYVGYFNEKYTRSGVLFQGKYKKVLVESDTQYNYLFAYINENHIVHNIGSKREMYHSSSLHYQKLGNSKVINNSVSNYDFTSAADLARSIYDKRTSMKDLLE
jgi:REP element-mobilizing transposase RayT